MTEQVTTKTGYAFCPVCREKGRTRRISQAQAIEYGVCNECLAEAQAKENLKEEITVAKESKAPKAAPKATKATPAVTGKPVKAPKPKGQSCGCGCGGTTKGGKFLPGHDAKFHRDQKAAAEKKSAKK